MGVPFTQIVESRVVGTCSLEEAVQFLLMFVRAAYEASPRPSRSLNREIHKTKYIAVEMFTE
jgi:hypothetical protein